MNFQKVVTVAVRGSQLYRQVNPVIVVRDKSTIAKLHLTPVRKYPEAKRIPLPDNLECLTHDQVAKWSPQRTRDITSPAILCHASTSLKQNEVNFQSTASIERQPNYDPRVESYDCTGAVSLNSSMQTNVPEPYCSGSKSTHYNMPGGQWEVNNKYTAEDLRSSHYVNTKRKLCTKADEKVEEKPLTKKEKLKLVFKEYGATIVVFHVTISLVSLGTCYLLVSSGLDVAAFVKAVGLGDSVLAEKLAAGTGTFIAAYALHKCFVPARMSITLAATPFIVKYLRKIGFLKRPISSTT